MHTEKCSRILAAENANGSTDFTVFEWLQACIPAIHSEGGHRSTEEEERLAFLHNRTFMNGVCEHPTCTYRATRCYWMGWSKRVFQSRTLASGSHVGYARDALLLPAVLGLCMRRACAPTPAYPPRTRTHTAALS